ncbi:podocalyxin [Podargus strigoides]
MRVPLLLPLLLLANRPRLLNLGRKSRSARFFMQRYELNTTLLRSFIQHHKPPAQLNFQMMGISVLTSFHSQGRETGSFEDDLAYFKLGAGFELQIVLEIDRFKCGTEDDSMTMFFEKMETKSPQDDAKVLLGPDLQPRGVSSQDVADKTTPSPGESGQTRTTTDNSKMQGTTSTSSPGSSPPTSITLQGTTTTNNPGNLPSPPVTSHATVQGTTSTNNLGSPPPVATTSPHQSQHVSSSASSRASIVTPAAISSTAQMKTSTPAGLGSLAATTAASSVFTHSSRPPTIPGGLGTSVSSPVSVKAQGSQPSDQLTSSPAASSRVPTSSLAPGLKDYSVSSPTSVTKHPHSSPSTPVQGLASSTRSGSINTSVTPSGGPTSPTTSKASPSSPSGSTNKVSEAITTTTLGADQRSHGAGSASTKPASADQSPASTQPPVPGDQTASSSPSHQHPCSFCQNEVICKDQVQNNWPTIYLKEAKTCAEWRTASANTSFFESFCSTGQHAFNASRETCTVTLTSREPRSQHWAVQAVVHIPLDPEKVLEELKEKKDKLEELGIANVTYDKTEREMIINDEFSTPLIITIVTLAGSLLLIAAIYGCCHQRFSQKKDQHIHPDLPGFDDGHVALIFNQRLTEELQTMENGYHDNPTLEVMETSSEMQEKKVNLNGELGDSWIVPLDTLMKEDLEEEEDTHL